MRRVALAALVVLLAGCGGSGTTKGSGHVVTVSRTVPGFTSIELAGAATVDVTVGKPAALTLRADDNVVPLIRTEVRDGKLVVSSKHGYTTSHELHLSITTPALDGVSITGTGTLTADGIRANAFSLDLSGAATITLAGETGALDANLSGTGTAELGDLVARDATVSLSGAGSVHVNSTASLDATVTGVGSVVYTGSPARVSTHVSGVGTVTGG
jgi:Putative auto-transporter adhesin, head GIN domain